MCSASTPTGKGPEDDEAFELAVFGLLDSHCGEGRIGPEVLFPRRDVPTWICGHVGLGELATPAARDGLHAQLMVSRTTPECGRA